MSRLIYSVITSLDGYTNDESGNFEWAAPDEQVHEFVNDREREIGTYLYGRRMYETMKVWQELDDDDPVVRDYATLWQAADKIVYSTTLSGVDTPRTALEPRFDADAVRSLADRAERDVSIGGPTVAAEALRAGIVDEVHAYVNPVVVGGGTHYLPSGITMRLSLLDERRFDSGVVYLRYAARP